MSEASNAHKILIVEDDETSSAMLVALVSKLGAETVTAVNADQVRSALAGTNFDLILMDVKLTGLSGIELTQEIRTKEKNSSKRTLIVAVTSCNSSEDKKNCLDAGMDGYFSKPINRVMFQTFIKKLLK